MATTLTELKCRNAKPGATIRKLAEAGLQLWITPDGAKRWRFSYRHDGRQKTISLGVYPDTSLAEARAARDAAKRLVRDGIDPSVERKQAKAESRMARGNTFTALAGELIAKKERSGLKPDTIARMRYFVDLLEPHIGGRPIADITAMEALGVLRKIEDRGTVQTAHKVRAFMSEVSRLAVVSGRALSNPVAALKGELTTKRVKHRPAIVDPVKFGGLLRAIDKFDGQPATRQCLQLLALTFTRPSELRAARWSEFDLDTGLWVVPAERMKMKREHRVPLSSQALAILRAMRGSARGDAYLFPNVRQRGACMSENTLMGALHRIGYGDDHSAHGFRASASSMLNESGLWHADAIERQLAHADNDSVRRAYARADFWDERIRMMTWWADRCDEMRRGGAVIQMPSGAA